MTVQQLIDRLQALNMPEAQIWIDNEEFGLCGIGEANDSDAVQIIAIATPSPGGDVLIGDWLQDANYDNH